MNPTWPSRFGALGAICAVILGPSGSAAQTGAVSGSGSAALVTAAAVTQPFASAALPAAGGMDDAELPSVSVPGTLSAEGLASITTGRVGQTRASVTSTAEAANVSVMGGLITAKSVVAISTSYANGVTAASESTGSALLGLVINGVNYEDAPVAPNTRVDLPGGGYVVLNEQVLAGDSIRTTSLTVNMIHAYLSGPAGASTEVVVGSARSAASR